MTHVTKETAQLLKEKGFDLPSSRSVDISDPNNKIFSGHGGSDWNALKYYVSIPEFQQVTEWLREAKGVHVYVSCNYGTWCGIVQSMPTGEKLESNNREFDTHDQALEAGIIYALKNYVK